MGQLVDAGRAVLEAVDAGEVGAALEVCAEPGEGIGVAGGLDLYGTVGQVAGVAVEVEGASGASYEVAEPDALDPAIRYGMDAVVFHVKHLL